MILLQVLIRACELQKLDRWSAKGLGRSSAARQRGSREHFEAEDLRVDSDERKGIEKKKPERQGPQ